MAEKTKDDSIYISRIHNPNTPEQAEAFLTKWMAKIIANNINKTIK